MRQLFVLVKSMNIWLACSQTGRPVVRGAVANFQFCTVKAWSQSHRASDIREKQLFQAGLIAPFAKDLVSLRRRSFLTGITRSPLHSSPKFLLPVC